MIIEYLTLTYIDLVFFYDNFVSLDSGGLMKYEF